MTLLFIIVAVALAYGFVSHHFAGNLVGAVKSAVINFLIAGAVGFVLGGLSIIAGFLAAVATVGGVYAAIRFGKKGAATKVK